MYGERTETIIVCVILFGLVQCCRGVLVWVWVRLAVVGNRAGERKCSVCSLSLLVTAERLGGTWGDQSRAGSLSRSAKRRVKEGAHRAPVTGTENHPAAVKHSPRLFFFAFVHRSVFIFCSLSTFGFFHTFFYASCLLTHNTVCRNLERDSFLELCPPPQNLSSKVSSPCTIMVQV